MPMLAAVLGLVLGFGVLLVLPAFRSYFSEDGTGGPGGAIG
jgi:hypothetical protein